MDELGAAEAWGISMDLLDPVSIDAAFREIDDRWGELNTLVNAAGPGANLTTFDQIADADWFEAYEIGAMSAVRCTRAALPLLRKAAWARVVNVSAHSTKRQTATLAAYTASEGRDDEHLEEHVARPRRRGDPGQHRLARFVRIRRVQGRDADARA
ncbi:MAG: SDR family oxidoreductase [Acidimicrobiales bacterium]